MSLTNPYKERGILPANSKLFFGRKQEMINIEGMLSGDQPQCVSIVGERRIGKSSLAFRVFHSMKNTQKTLAVYLDCDGISGKCQTKDQFFQLLNRDFICAVEKNPELLDKVKKGDYLFNCYDSFKEFVTMTGAKKIKTIIFMDEFEHLPTQEFADNAFFSNLRAVANDPRKFLAFVVITKTALKSLTHRDIKSSGFWNIFDEQAIGLLDNYSIERLRRYGFRENSFQLTEAEKKKIHYYAGNSPFFNQLVCYMIWNSKNIRKEINWHRCESKIRPYYEQFWEVRTKEEQILLKNLKKGAITNEPLLTDLEVRGLLVEEDGIYTAFSGYFSRLIDDFFTVNEVIKPRKG